MLNESHSSPILVLHEHTKESGELLQLLRQHFSVSQAHTKDAIERLLRKDVSLVIAQQGLMTRLGISIPEYRTTTPCPLWILLMTSTDSEHCEQWKEVVYHCVEAPWAPENICRLAVRTAEHYQLVLKHHRLQEEYHRLRAGNKTQVNGHSAHAEKDAHSSPLFSEETCPRSHQPLGEIVQSEKMVVLGRMVSGIAHEINTPSGAINAASVNLNHHLKLLVESLHDLELQQITKEHSREILTIVGTMLQSLEDKHRRSPSEVRLEQKRLANSLQQQELADCRKISKDIARMNLSAHIDMILRLAKVYGTDRILLFFTHCHRIVNSAKDINLSIDILTRIILALKSYSYPWQEQLELADVHETIETALILLKNKLKHQIHIDYHFADVPKMLCYPGELIHVWVNIIYNAIQAIKETGDILIETHALEGYLEVEITDTGVGISPDVQPKIFDLNFTTKSREEGSGQGLYIVRQIIEKHEGCIEVSSRPGQTTFKVQLPFKH